jgi:hypothetical protein
MVTVDVKCAPSSMKSRICWADVTPALEGQESDRILLTTGFDL